MGGGGTGMGCVGEGWHAQIVTSVRGVHHLQESVYKTESVTHEGEKTRGRKEVRGGEFSKIE